ncbi:Nicotinamide-nucleotide adenylyltransferase, NadR family / Ribosylnicotinamide kinase [Pasteurellaceae bacterium NI1060]|nr:Nicotinamide-nucleotide adenylyltransferase, NadR family / Ribosylnicotinamide kinase [Pasteurellaceae bacterium NI1060]
MLAGFTAGREFHPALRMRAKYSVKSAGAKSEREKYFHLTYNTPT